MLKKLKIVLMLAAVFAVAGCKAEVTEEEEVAAETPKYTITYDAAGHGTAPEAKTVEEGYKLTEEDLPALTADGFDFGGWKFNEKIVAAGEEVVSDMTLIAVWTEWGTVATPTFSIAAGEVDKGTKVTITCATEGAVIYYTTDGSAPTASSTKYESEEIEITPPMTIKAFAVKSGMKNSGVASAEYTIKLYTVTFDADGHGTAPDAMKGYKSQTITLPAALTEAGWLFEKWNDGTADYDAGASYTVNGNITFTAKWKDVAPAEVTNLTAKCTGSGKVKLTWENPTDADFAKVVITYGTDGKVEVLKTATPNNEATIEGLTDGTEYTFTVKSYDTAENESSGVSVKCFSGNGGLSGTPKNGQTQGTVIKETWMDETTGNIKINGAEITKTSEVVVVPAGTVAKINMTSDDANISLFTSSRKVKLSPFVMSQYPVTRGLFKAVMGDYYNNIKNNQAGTTRTEDENPINYVNWFDAIVFCNKLSITCGLTPVYSYYDKTKPDEWFADTNLSETVPTSISSTNYSNWNEKVVINLKANGYRLPTDAEWEFCARGGDPNAEDWGYIYSGSNTVTDVAWYKGNSGDSGTNIAGCMNKANRLGLYDMSGNVYEWCDDFYNSSATVDDSKYTDSEGYVKDPMVVSVSSYRRLRGGSWFYYANYCEVGYRYFNNPYYRYNSYGFRLVRSTETN